MRAWADARQGPEKALVLAELATRLQTNGASNLAMQALSEAAEADPRAEVVLNQLIERSTAQGDFPSVVRWLEQLALATDPGPDQDTRWRRLLEVANDYAGDPAAAIRALEGMTKRSQDETRSLAELYVDQGRPADVVSLSAHAEILGAPVLLKAGGAIAKAGKLDEGRRFLQLAMEAGESKAAWRVAESAWAAAGKLADLGKWRLETSRHNVGKEALRFKLLGYADVVEGGASGDAIFQQGTLEAAAREIDAKDNDQLWALHRAARAQKHLKLLDDTARTLEARLPEADPRLGQVLRTRIHRELEQNRADAAVDMAERLSAMGDEEGDKLLDLALTKAGRQDELLARLYARAEAATDGTAPLWIRIAALRSEASQWAEAAMALRRVPEAARNERWGEHCYKVGSALQDAKQQVEGARTAAERTTNDGARAQWLRKMARVLWWTLGDEDGAVAALKQAHNIVPMDLVEASSAAETHRRDKNLVEAGRVLDEAIAVMPPADAAPLVVERALMHVEKKELREAREVLERALPYLSDDGGAWAAAGRVAAAVNDADLAVKAWARAASLEPASYEEEHIQTLEALKRWVEAATALEQRAERTEGNVAARSLEKAAVFYERSGDKPRALTVLERAVKRHATLESMSHAFVLSVELRRTSLTAALGGSLLKRLDPNAKERLPILRSFTDALEHLGLFKEAQGPREELLKLGQATARDKAQLARIYSETDAKKGAPLLEQAANETDDAERGPLWTEAAAMWRDAGDNKRAAGALLHSLEAGADTPATHLLALELLTGEARLTSLARVVELEADASWPPDRKSVARLELARARLVLEDAEGALQLLKQAEGFGSKPQGWAIAMEQALSALGRQRDLAELYVATMQGQSPWKPDDEVERLLRAADVFKEAQAVVEESQALELLKKRRPNHPGLSERLGALAAELGDKDRYIEVVRAQLTSAGNDVTARDTVLVRAASVLVDKFGEAPAARALLEPHFVDKPSAALGRALETVLDKLGDTDAAVPMYQKAATHAEAILRADLVARAGELSELAGEDEAAYALWREVLELQPGHERAQQGAATHAERGARWDELVEIATQSAAAATGKTAHDWLVRAADVMREHLKDPAREAELLAGALTVDDTQKDTAARLLDLRLDREEMGAAKALLLTSHLPASREEALVRRAVNMFEQKKQNADAEAVMGWLIEQRPDSPLAAEYRVAQARSRGDRQTLRAALRSRLDSSSITPAAMLAMRREAMQLALQDGDRDTALAEAGYLLSAPDVDVDAIFDAWRITELLGVSDLAASAVTLAAPSRDVILSRAAGQQGELRVRWLELLGLVSEQAEDEQGALGAYTQALTFDNVSAPVAFRGLERLYARRGEWDRLLQLCQDRGERATSAEDRAEAFYRAAVVCRDHLVDENKAESLLGQALGQDSSHGGAQLAYGLLLRGRHQLVQALPYLETQVQTSSPDTPVENLQALAECLRAAGQNGKALTVIDTALRRAPERTELHPVRAEILESSGQKQEAEQAWLNYLDVLGSGADPQIVVPVLRRLAATARDRGDTPAAASHLQQAYRLLPDDAALISELRALLEMSEQWLEATELRLREATLATDPRAQAQHYRMLGTIFRDHLSESRRAAVMLEKAVELGGADVPLLYELLALHETAANWPRYIAIGERVMAETPEAQHPAELYARMAQAYQEGNSDLVRAKEFYGKALEKAPNDAGIKAKHRALAEATGDFKTFAASEEEALALYPPGDEKADRLTALADIYLRNLQQLDKAAATIQRALDIRKNDPALLRRLADVHALEPSSYPKAAELYRSLLEQSPLDGDLLRILARLSGQVGDTDRAYGYYAALLVLLPSDTEAQRFVTACRAARPVGPQRALTDADRAQGLIHPGQASPFEDVFTPLARFAELTVPGDLNRRGISADRDGLEPTDARKQYLQKILEPLGVPQAKLFVWRAGGFACEIELTNPVSILLGSVVANDAPERQRAFLVARSGELYRSGHMLCDRLNPGELASLVAAQCMAVVPGMRPPMATSDSDRWAQVISGPMTPQIRSMIAPKVQAFLQKAGEADVTSWRRAAISTASRTAMLVSCDVEEAVSALLRLHGFDDLTDEQRVPVLQEANEELDLVRFATSELYFKLRQTLGLALRRSR